MALREIDRFEVRPSGLFARWRHKRVMIDENGNVSSAPVPGESETMNLPCISDYKKVNRRYATGAKITEFCNIVTHTNFRVYAQDCEPFAYVQTDLNAPKCGYEEPLPAPAVPPAPFGVPTYGEFAYLDICDNKNIPINIKIFKRGFTGTPIKIKNGGATPAIIRYKNTDDYKLSSIRPADFQLTVVSDKDFNYEKLYTEDEREYKVQVTKGGTIKFVGFGTATEATEEFKGGPYDITWRATDGLEALKKITYPLPNGSRSDIQQKFLDILIFCLAKTDLNINLSTVHNLYEVKMTSALDDDPLVQSSINPLRFVEKGVTMNCYQVLEKVCEEFGAFLVQDKGIWNYTRQSELALPALRRRMYNSTGLFLYSEQISNRRLATCKGPDITMLDDKPMLRIGNAYKRAEVSVEFGEVPLLIFNGDFELYDGFNFAGWTKYGGIDVLRIENKIRTATGFVWSGDHALSFNQLADSGKYIQARPIKVTKGDKISFSFNVGNTGQTPLIRNSQGINGFKLRIKVGNYYLHNPEGDNKYIWDSQLVTCTIPVSNPIGDINTYKVELELPEMPVTGDMIIQLYGFVQKTPVPYYATEIDNLAIQKSGTVEAAGRSLYLSEQDGFYTTKAEEVKLLFGDYMGGNLIARPMRDGSGNAPVEITNDYYAIRTKDGSYSTNWYEYHAPGEPMPVGLILARNIMKAYQKPFRFLESSFLGLDLSYLDVINVILPNDSEFSARIFALLSGELDLISGELKNAVFAEIFDKDIKTVKVVIPGLIMGTYPPIVQNPNPSEGEISGVNGKIFKRQFKQPFQ